MLALVHSFSPLSSLHIGRSVGRPLGQKPSVTEDTRKENKRTYKNLRHGHPERFLLVCITRQRVPPLVLVHMNVPDVSLLLRRSRFDCRAHGHQCNASH